MARYKLSTFSESRLPNQKGGGGEKKFLGSVRDVSVCWTPEEIFKEILWHQNGKKPMKGKRKWGRGSS